MDFYKKLKASKPVENESITSILGEVDRKLADMQPVIQDQATDKSKVQKTILDIKARVESLKAFGGSVTPEQQERIKEVSRKYNEISVKHSYVSDVDASIPKSPRSFRKRVVESKEMVQMPQNKLVFQHQVEETLKVMRQKRLDRLSVFVAEQSKLSEERSNKHNDSSEIENAIKSIQKSEVDSKSNFKSISEENIIQHRVIKEEENIIPNKVIKEEENIIQNKVIKEEGDIIQNTAIKEEVQNIRNSPKLERSRSNESEKLKNSKSSTLRLINRFKCVPLDSSSEDLTDVYNKASNTRDNIELSQEKYSVLKSNENISTNDTHGVPDNLEVTNVLLSPRGKQRKAVYMYDHECQFLEGEKRSSLPPLSTFGKEISPENKKVETKPKIHTYENRDIIIQHQTLPKQVTKVQNDGNINVINKINHVYENSEIQLSITKFQEPMSRDEHGSRRSLENVCDLVDKKSENSSIKINSETTIKTKEMNSEHNKKVSDKKPPRLVIKSDLTRRKLHRNLENVPATPRTPKSPLKSPQPFPRRNNQAERVLKKVQRNWESLNEILENDSDVDCDEIEDLKKTWEEANAFLSEYKAKVSKLDRKSREEENMGKVDVINAQLDEVEEEIGKFKGLKRDSSYMQLSSRLSNYFLDVSKINFSNTEGVNNKQNTLKKIDRNIKKLESKVLKNESMLIEMLEMQVRSIGTNYLCITKV